MDNRRAQMAVFRGGKKAPAEPAPLYETVTDLTTGETFLLESPVLDIFATEEKSA